MTPVEAPPGVTSGGQPVGAPSGTTVTVGAASVIVASRLRVSDLVNEAISAITARLMRSALTTLGVVLAVGTFVSVLGLTATATGQISSRFDELTATTVTAADARQATDVDNPIPEDTDDRVARLNGVVSAGTVWKIRNASGAVRATGRSTPTSTQLVALSPGAWVAIGAHFSAGGGYGRFAEASRQRAVVLGAIVARRLGLTDLTRQPAILIDDVPFVVVGVLDKADTRPDLLADVMLPRSTAAATWGQPAPGGDNALVVKTRLGAAQQVARELPYALIPQEPNLLTVTPPPDPRSLRDDVNIDLAGLFYALAFICLIVGAVGIANTTLVAVFERTAELGLRRALGAKRRHLAAHIVTESAALGLLGGIVGAAVGVAVVLVTALTKSWTPIIHPLVIVGAPLLGLATGAVAGLYPAAKAANIEPSEALRR